MAGRKTLQPFPGRQRPLQPSLTRMSSFVGGLEGDEVSDAVQLYGGRNANLTRWFGPLTPPSG